MILTADCILPVSSPPVYDGAVVIEGSKILAVGQEETLAREYPGHERRTFRNCALLPGLVNAHTHLELTALKGRVPADAGFVSWILALIREKKSMSAEQIRESIRAGAEEALDSGTTCLGEITNTPFSPTALCSAGLRAAIFLEVLGKEPVDGETWKENILHGVEALQSGCGERIRVGLSPHSPFTLSGQRLRLISELLRQRDWRYTMHVAETREEMDYFLHRQGDIENRFFPAVEWRGLPDPEEACRPVHYLDGLGLLTDRLLIAHGAHLDAGEMDRIRETGARVVICPRSNDFLGVGRPPIEALIRKGITVGLGTDSLASNTSLSLWDEMRHLMSGFSESDTLTADVILRMATLGGAEGLGFGSLTGSIEAGKDADLIAVEWNRTRGGDPYRDLIRGTENRDVRMVMIAGRILREQK